MEMQNNNLPPAMQQPLPASPHKADTVTYHQAKSLFDISKGDITFIIFGIIGCVFTALFGLFSGFALGYLISSVLMTAIFILYLAKGGKRRVFPIVCGFLTLANAAIFVCTSNGSVRFFGVVVGFLLMLCCFDGLVNGSQKGNLRTVGIFYSAASALGNIGVALKSIFSGKKGKKKSVGKVMLGLVCALPVLVIVIPLLISSDDAFRGLMDRIFENTVSSIAKIIVGLGISVLVIPYGLSIKAGRVAKIKKGTFAGIENVYIISFLSAIVLCYLLYLFSQLAYFFSAFKGFLPEGDMTYAQYARKGFFEMCTIAVINLLIVFAAWFLAKTNNGKLNASIKAMLTFIAVFTLIIIATAISKMVLYINAYGMTVLRLTTSAFMVFLSVVFISLILKIFIRKINFIKTALLAAGVIIVTLGTVNVNSVCAEYNYESYASGKLETVDATALYNLGDEGIPYLVKLAKNHDDDIAHVAEDYLKEAYMYDYFNGLDKLDYFTVEDLKEKRLNSGFESFSIPKKAAYEALYEYIEENPGFCYSCQDYYNQNSGRYDFW